MVKQYIDTFHEDLGDSNQDELIDKKGNIYAH